MTSIVFVSLAMTLMSPPVATTVVLVRTSSFMRVTIPSTRPAYPYMMPACMLLTVSFATTDFGLPNSTRGSFDARSKRASLDTRSPGAMHPPIYSPLLVT